MKYLLAVLIIVGWAMNANAEIVTEVVDYKHGEVTLEGYAAHVGLIRYSERAAKLRGRPQWKTIIQGLSLE